MPSNSPQSIELNMKKIKGRSRRLFYRACVQYVKKRRNRINPKDTTYAALAIALEGYAKIPPGTGNGFNRCKAAAPLLGIELPRSPTFVSLTSTNKIKIGGEILESNFYSTLAWKKLRYSTLKRYGGKCQCCGETGKNSPLRVDHIKPISKFWGLRLDPENLQVLCNDCNWGKLNIDQTDWREPR